MPDAWTQIHTHRSRLTEQCNCRLFEERFVSREWTQLKGLKEGPAARLAENYSVSLRDFYREVQFKLLITAIAILISPVEKPGRGQTRRTVISCA
jgi:hypothetical protein